MLLAVPGPMATAPAGQAQGVQTKPVWFSTGIGRPPPQSEQLPNAGKIFKFPQQFCVLVWLPKTICMLRPIRVVMVKMQLYGSLSVQGLLFVDLAGTAGLPSLAAGW